MPTSADTMMKGAQVSDVGTHALVTATAVAAAVAATAAREDACVKDLTSVIAASCMARASASFSLYSASASSSSNACRRHEN
jgi:hypothetical protein